MVFRPRSARTQESNLGPKLNGKLSPKGPYSVTLLLKRADGTTFRRTAEGLPTKHEAREKRDSFFEEFNILEGGPAYAKTLTPIEETPAPQLMLFDFLDDCVENVWPVTHPQTARNYGLSVKNHIKPNLPNRPLQELRRNDIRALVMTLLKTPANRGGLLSTSAVKNAIVALGSACSIAIEREHLETNPTHDLGIRWKSLRPHDQSERVFLSQDQLATVLEVSRDLPIYPVVLLQAKLGLRIGEALALSAEDFDLQKKTVRIAWQVTRDTSSTGKVYPPKSQAGKRTIPVPDTVFSYVTGKTGLLLTGDSGSYYDHSKAIKAYEEVKRLAKLEKFTSHALRHTFVSHMLNELKVPPTVVQKLAGHSSVIVTLQAYSHASEDNLVEAMNHIS